ncbi:MAG: hypothetical protein ACK4SL_00585 [Candidatus Paceibacteria bacterium]
MSSHRSNQGFGNLVKSALIIFIIVFIPVAYETLKYVKTMAEKIEAIAEHMGINKPQE